MAPLKPSWLQHVIHHKPYIQGARMKDDQTTPASRQPSNKGDAL